MPDIISLAAQTDLTGQHVDYPHEPGYLFDCPACESSCHCSPGSAECVYDGPHKPVIKACACGIPNKANWHTSVILGRDVSGGTETTCTDIYSCDAHLSDDPRAMLRWDGHEAWQVIESVTTHLR